MDRYLQRTENKNILLRPQPKKFKPHKRQTTITSLSKVVSLDSVQDLSVDLKHLTQLFDAGTSDIAPTQPGPGTLRQQVAANKRAKWKEEHDELEMSDDGAGSSSSSVSGSISGSAASSSTPATSDTQLGARILSVLKQLSGMHIALETLESTLVGKVVKRLTKPTKKTKRIFPAAIVEKAKLLVDKWRITAEEGLSRRRRRKESGVDDVVIPRGKRAKLDFHFRR